MKKELTFEIKRTNWQVFNVKVYYSKKNGKPTGVQLFLNCPGEHEYIKKVFIYIDKVAEVFGSIDTQDLNASLVGLRITFQENIVEVVEAE